MDLSNQRTLITRPRAQAGQFAAALRSAGAEPIIFPVIEIAPTADTIALDRALKKMDCYSWLVLTSINGVKAVWERFGDLSLSGPAENVRVAAIGPETAAALQERGVYADFVPSEYVAEAILPGLGDLRGRWVLLPRAELARPVLPIAIQAADGIAHEIVAYRTLPAQPDPIGLKSISAGVDIVTFTSSSTVRNFIDLASRAGFDPHNLPGDPIIACIGPVTANTAQEQGLPVNVVASEYTIAGLLKALLDA